MLKPDQSQGAEHRLSLRELLEGLLSDGRISAGNLRRLQGLSPASIHPLVFLAEQKLPDLATPGATLDMPALLGWLGGR